MIAWKTNVEDGRRGRMSRTTSQADAAYLSSKSSKRDWPYVFLHLKPTNILIKTGGYSTSIKGK